MGIFERFRSATTEKEYSEAIPDGAAALNEAKAKLASLEASREEAIFSNTPGQLDRVNSEIAAAEENIATLEILLRGAQRRRDEAAARERREMVERTMAPARGKVEERIALMKALHLKLREVAADIERFNTLGREIEGLNRFAMDEGRADLMVTMPMKEWNETVREARAADARSRFAERHPGENPGTLVGLQPGDIVHMPMPSEGVILPGYAGGQPRHWLEIVFPDLRPPAGDGAGVVESITSAFRRKRA